MNETIIISMSRDRSFTENLEKLHLIVPTAIQDEDDSVKTNPFIDYVLEKDSIRRDLYEFLYHSDFLQVINQNAVQFCKELYDRNAALGWFNMFLTVFEEKPDKDEFCEVIMVAFRKNISIKDTLVMFEANETASEMRKNIDIFLQVNGGGTDDGAANVSARYEIEKYEQIIDQLNGTIAAQKQKIIDLEAEKDRLAERNADFFDQIETANKTVLEIKKEILMYRSDREKIINYKKENDKLLKTTRDTLEKYVTRIRVLEGKIISIGDELSEANASLDEQRVHIDQLNETNEKLRSENEHNAVLAEQYHEQLLNLASKGLEESEGDSHKDTDASNTVSEKDMARLDEVEVVGGSDEEDGNSFFDDPGDSFEDEAKEAYGEEPEEIDYGYEDMKELTDNSADFKLKSNFFMDFMLKHSEKYFNKRPRQEQENRIFIKMMDMAFSKDKMQLIKSNLNETVSCFELYRLISRDPSEDDIRDFFNEHGLKAVTE